MGKLPIPDYVRTIRERIDDEKYVPEAIRIILEENGIREYPINVYNIAQKMGFEVKLARFKDTNVSGILWDGNEEASFNNNMYKRVIFVNKDESPERQLFTIAHEIGHFMIHCNDESNFYERYITNKGETINKEQKEMEDRADYFAANLLLPKDILIQYIKVNNLRDRRELEKEVMRDFFVEKETISRRLGELNYAECF